MVTTRMGITNKTRKTDVAKQYKLCRSVGSKARGLMFTNESQVLGAALLFEFRRAAEQSLHMFFVFYPIDVLFLDEKKKVVDVKEGFRPFTVYNSRQMAKYVLELPRGTVRRSKTCEGDVLKW
jgi:uncharacterized membrane protein (UPF0127 family)